VQVATGVALRAANSVLRKIGVNRTGGPAGQAMPHTHILGERFWSQGALRYGDYIAKISAVPVSANLTELAGQRVPVAEPSALRDLVSDFFKTQRATWELRVQLATDLERTPIEDASVEWPEYVSSYFTVATLTADAQDSYSPARRDYADDTLAFNPWHCLLQHQPLGSIQRVRRPVYHDSSVDRHRLNARPRTEPHDISDLPA
jgi:hypothetical protein